MSEIIKKSVGNLTIENINNIIDNFDIKDKSKTLNVDFEDCNKARLLPSLVFGNWLKTLENLKSYDRNKIRTSRGGSYLVRIGFFNHLSNETQNGILYDLTAAKMHIPFVEIKKDDYIKYDLDEDINKNITDKMNEISKHLLKNINFETKKDKEKAETLLTFLFREITRNTFEHGSTDKHIIAAQIQPINKRVEIALVDEGCGIVSSYTSNPLFENYVTNKVLALKKSLRPGSSRLFENEISHDKKETTWDNSGYGLYMASRLSARLKGKFNLISSGYHLEFSYNYENKEYVTNVDKNAYSGCAIGMEFDLSEIRNINIVKDEILKEANDLVQTEKNVFRTATEYSQLKL